MPTRVYRRRAHVPTLEHRQLPHGRSAHSLTPPMRCHHSARPYRDASAPPLTRCAGVVLAKLGASATTLTDLAPNLPLLRANVAALLLPADTTAAGVEVRALAWGHGAQGCSPPYDLLVGCDLMYIRGEVNERLLTPRLGLKDRVGCEGDPC